MAPRVHRAVTARPVPAVLAAPTMPVPRGHVARLAPPAARGARATHQGTARRARVAGATTLVRVARRRTTGGRAARVAPTTTAVLVARGRMVDPIVLVARVPMVRAPVDPPPTIAALAVRVGTTATVVLVARVRMVDPIVLVARVPMVRVRVVPPTTIAALAARVPMVRAAGPGAPTTIAAPAVRVPMVRAAGPGVTIGPAIGGPVAAPVGVAVPTAHRVDRPRPPSDGRPRSRRPVARR